MMKYSMVEEVRELVGWSKEKEALSSYGTLSTLKDRRGK
jgi:hypothetical protein